MHLVRRAAPIAAILLLAGTAHSTGTAVDLGALGLSPEGVAAVLVEPPYVSVGCADDQAAEELIAKAAGQWREGKTGEALLGWACIVRERAGTVQALKALFRIAGYVAEEESDPARAVSIYESAAAARPGDRYCLVVARMWEAELFLSLASLNPEEGIRRLEELADQCAGTAEQGLPWLRLAAYYLERGDQVESERYYQEVVTRYPSAWYVPYAAFSRCQDLIELRARTYPFSWETLTEVCFRELDRALAHADPGQSPVLVSRCLFLRGELFREAERWQEAEASFELLAAHDPRGEWGANGVLEAAWCAAELRETQKVQELCDDLLRRLASATWLRRRQLGVFRSQIQRIRDRCAQGPAR